MRIVFMGTPEFAVPTLDALAGRHDVVAVVTRPDAVSRRGSQPVPSPVKEAALMRGLSVIEAPGFRDTGLVDRLRALEPDITCVAAYGAILPPSVLGIPRFGCINAHASLLPRHRGAAPIERAILVGDPVTGVSIMRMEEGLDTGPVCLRVAVEIKDESASALTERLARIAADAVLAALEDVAVGRAAWIPQDHARATYAAKLTRDDVRIAPELDATAAWRRVRASSDRATVRVRLHTSTDLVVTRAQPSDHSISPGRAIMTPQGPVLGFAEGALLLVGVKPAGKRELTGKEFACGARLPDVFSWSPL